MLAGFWASFESRSNSSVHSANMGFGGTSFCAIRPLKHFLCNVSQIFPSVHFNVQPTVCCLRQAACGQTCPSGGCLPAAQPGLGTTHHQRPAAARRRPSLPLSFSTLSPPPWAAYLPNSCLPLSAEILTPLTTPPLHMQWGREAGLASIWQGKSV